jgi:glycosyltransferase involved in cell wall biosynthesis
MSLAAGGADRIIAVSAAGRDEIVAGLGVEGGRIDVVPNGVRPAPASPLHVGRSTAELRERHRLGERQVVLTVASNLPHKNLPRLLDALGLLAPAERPMLLIVGHGTDDAALRAQATAVGVAEDLRLLGGCSTTELDSLYSIADCMALPTLHEGFGLPVLEAMARSIPVVCSDIPALREVGGSAALYFDPRAPEQIAARLMEVLADDSLGQRLRKLGRAQAAGFSWSAAAEGTLASYRRALGAPQSPPQPRPRSRGTIRRSV